MYLISGASGNVGGELVRALRAAGEPVRALTRGARPPGVPAHVEIAAADLDQPETLRPALDGVQGVFLLPGYRDMPGLLAEIRTAGVRNVVLLSGSSAGSGDTGNAISAYMIRSERAVLDSDVDATILRPSGFMSNALRWISQLTAGDVVREPFAGVAVAVIDPADIAAVAARALRSPAEHRGQTYLLSGPEALLPADRLRILGSVLGRELRLDPQPDDEAREQMSAEMPAEYVAAFFNFYVDGALDESPVRPTVQRILDRAPRTFEQWARAHAADFRPGS